MHSMVISVYRKKKSSRAGDEMIWNREQGFLVPVSRLVHGLVLWALTEGRENKARIEMRFCEPLGEIVFPEKFVKKKQEYKSWESIKASIKIFFNGPKPDDVSWNEAKVMMREAEARKRQAGGPGLVRWPSLMEHRAGSRVLRSA